MELKLDKLVKIEKKENSKMRGIAKVLIDDCFLVEDIRILEGDEGLFIAMPSKTLPDGSHRDTAHPINKETRKLVQVKIEDAVQADKITSILMGTAVEGRKKIIVKESKNFILK